MILMTHLNTTSASLNLRTQRRHDRVAIISGKETEIKEVHVYKFYLRYYY